MVFRSDCKIREAEMGSRRKEALKSLCCNNGWSYGVFWRVNSRNSMLLTLDDAYYGEQFGMVISRMLQQVHMLGEGIIGQAAFTGKYQWLFSDTYCGEWSPTGTVESQDVFQGNSEFHRQFSSGIKTIAVISVVPWGVVQFGSTQKIIERSEFVDHAQSLFQQMESVGGLILSAPALTELNTATYDSSGSFASIVLSGNSFSNNGNIKPLHDDSCNELRGKAHSSMILTQSSPNTTELHHSSMAPLISNSFHLKNQFQMTSTEAQVILSTPSMQSSQVLLQSSSSCTNNTVTRDTTTSTWSSKGSTLISFEQQLLSEMGMQGSLNMSSANVNTPVSFRNTFANFQGEDSAFTPLCSGSLDMVTETGLLTENNPMQYRLGESVDIQQSIPLTEDELLKRSSSFCTFPWESRPSNVTTALSKPDPVSNLSQLVTTTLEQGNNGLTSATPNENLSQALGVVSASSSFSGGDVFSDISNHVTSSVQNPVTNTTNSLGAVCDGKGNSLDAPMQLPSENDLFDSLELDFGFCQGQECWDDMIMSTRSGSRLSAGISECISELDVGSMTDPQKGFFSEFGIEQLLDGVVHSNSFLKPSSEDSTTTITRTGSTSGYSKQIQSAGLSCLGGTMDAMLPDYNLEKMNILGTQKENIPKSQVGSWIADSYSVNVESAVITEPKRSEEPVKNTRKRARPGESTRPRPKDRQQIQDRVKELREIVPNGSKCSIDALLDRTVKHMVFLQSVTKYADKLKQADEPKMIGEESGVLLKDNSSGGGGNGATWAFEVRGQTMVCPIMVEDLSPPGQMLVEMLCEERGFFLEIADIIRAFGLTILKGLMEVREDKIWARFVIEANRDITRMDIFLSLVQLLQQTETSGIGSRNQPSKVVDSGVPLFTNYQQSPTPLPISLADRMQ